MDRALPDAFALKIDQRQQGVAGEKSAVHPDWAPAASSLSLISVLSTLRLRKRKHKAVWEHDHR